MVDPWIHGTADPYPVVPQTPSAGLQIAQGRCPAGRPDLAVLGSKETEDLVSMARVPSFEHESTGHHCPVMSMSRAVCGDFRFC